jgi:LuxR family maltose regulon positive regulatory protein
MRQAEAGIAGRARGITVAEPPATSPVEVAASQEDALLATKLYVPGPQPGFVARPRLVERLEEGLARGLLLVCAPAGFGKTSLLADWARCGGRPVAWLSLDAGDNDPARFWRHVVAALDRARPGIAEQVAPLLGPPPPRSFEGLVTTLINQLAAQPDQVVLVLDDYHLVEAQPVHASLGFLLEHRPSGLHLALTGRADPPLALARLRGRGQLAELRDADLRFTAEEAAALLRGAVGPDLPEAAVAVLAVRTEGWAAGLQLAGLSLRGQADVAGFVATFSGSHRFVLDYLTEEVLERQPEPVRTFLLETSVLEQLSGPLCDAVTGRSDSQRLLEQVERANLFLVPLDDVRGWWRYHQLFADLLRVRLQQQQPERVPQLHRAAAAWSEARGLADDAVRHALAAGDGVWAARLAERHADELLLHSEGATVQRWLAALPAELVGSRPRLLLAQARLTLLSGRVEGVDDLLDTAERAFAEAADEPYEPSTSRAASLLANVPATMALDRAYLAELRGDADRAIAFGRQALTEIGEDEWMLQSNASGYLGVAEWLGGRLAAAERLLSSTIAQWLRAGQRQLAVRTCHHLGQVQRAQGRLDAALVTYRRALEVAAPPGQPALPSAGMAYVGMAEVAYQRGELDAALEHLTEGLELCRQLVNPAPALRARLLLARGDLAAAAGWTKQRGLGANDQPSYPHEPEYLVLARVLLSQDRPDQALGLLQRLHAAAAAQGRLGSLIEIQALRALALAGSGDEAGAVAVLAEALTLACPQGYVRMFADEGAPMGTLLGRLVAAQRTAQSAAGGVPLDCLARLLRAFDTKEAEPRSGRGAAAAVPGLVEQLTDRELQVLGLLAAGRSNQGIAQELVVSLDTVKKHVGHLLDKLGAANRMSASLPSPRSHSCSMSRARPAATCGWARAASACSLIWRPGPSMNAGVA